MRQTSRIVAAVIGLLLSAPAAIGGASDSPALMAPGSIVSDSITAVVAKVGPSVVQIVTVRPPKPAEEKRIDKIVAAVGGEQTTSSFGSGFIIDPAGYIATNKHVVEDAIGIFVAVSDGTHHRAAIVGMPSKADIALLKIDAGRPLPALSFADSDKVQVGDKVIAIGCPFGFDNSVTAGIISGVNRDIMESPFDDYFQTDASTNLGNSGGPLLNMAGDVIGMNSVIYTPDHGWVGLTFAVPSNDLRFVFDRLMQTGEVKAGMLPIHTQQVTWMLQQALDAPGLAGALVTAVEDNDGQMPPGLIKAGDVVLTFNGQPVLDPRDLARKAMRAAIGSDAVLEIFRSGGRITAHLTLLAWPETRPDTPRRVQRVLGLDMAFARRDNGTLGVTVASIDPSGTAADSGLQKGDIILEIQQTPVVDPDQAARLFSAQSSRQHRFVAVLVERGKTRSWVALPLPG